MFERWRSRLTLIGWVLEEDGTFQPNYVLSDVPPAVVDAVAADLDPDADNNDAVLVNDSDGLAAGAGAHALLLLRVLGELSTLESTSPEEQP